MKIFLPLLLILSLLLGGCARHNAFERFNLNVKKELTEDSIQTVKIKKGNETDGILNVVYLNKVFPSLYKDHEYFYIYYYLKDKNETVSFFLNNKPSLLLEELPADNNFSKLTSFDASWSKYYLVEFQKEGNILNLTLKTNKAASATLQFIKDK